MVSEDNEDEFFGINVNTLPTKVTLPSIPERYLQIEYLETKCQDDSTISSNHEQISMQLPFAMTPAYQAKVIDAKYLVNDGDKEDTKKVIELTLNASGILNDFIPGDTIAVLPENDDKDVQFILNALQLEDKADNEIRISLSLQNMKKPNKIPSHIPLSSTPRKILKQCLNINSIPKKLFLRSLVEYTINENEKNFLKFVCSKEGSEVYTKLITEKNLTFKKLLKICTTCKPNLEILLENLQRLLPRPYSISNYDSKNMNEIQIVFSILKTEPGITTNYLQKITNKFLETSKNSNLYVNYYLRERNQFTLNKSDLHRDIIMISIGCGVSPFLSFLRYKENLCKTENSLCNCGEMWLFTGYKYHRCSLYLTEIRNFLKNGIINEHFESYSKQSDWKYKYVQDHITENKERFYKMIYNENSLIYVCADGAHISKSIQQTIQQIIEEISGCTNDEAKLIFKELQKNGRYREDIWI